ncbi:hypothetical protein [Pontibacter akesuensis]|nr:hypothetical protein [Pontibacter akesuensis]
MKEIDYMAKYFAQVPKGMAAAISFLDLLGGFGAEPPVTSSFKHL